MLRTGTVSLFNFEILGRDYWKTSQYRCMISIYLLTEWVSFEVDDPNLVFLCKIYIFWVYQFQFSSVAQSCPTLCDPMNRSTLGLPVHHQPLESSQTHPLSQSCHPTISSSVVPFSSCPQSFPASGSCQMNQLLTSGGQSIGVAGSKSVLPMNTQDWSPLRWTGWISLQSKRLSRVFSNTAVQKHQFFGT